MFNNDKKLLEVATRVYAKFDESHGLDHAQRVHDNACKIHNDNKLLRWLAALHDGCDYKYADESIGAEQLKQIFANEFGDEHAMFCMTLINNISWSKRATSVKMTGDWKTLQEVVQDADWLEAIGNIGIKRCEIYSIEHGDEVPAAIIKHIHEKLIHVADALNTPTARNMAIPLHQELLDYLRLHL